MAPLATLVGDWLDQECQRIVVLCRCLIGSRQGKAPDSEQIQSIQSSQKTIQGLRAQLHTVFDPSFTHLNQLDLDIALFVLAPEVNPRVAALYQELQNNSTSRHPHKALISELLFLIPSEIPEFRARFSYSAP